MVMMVPVYLGCICAKSLVLIYFSMFYAGLVFIGRFTNSYILLTELVPEKRQSIVGPFLLSMDVAVVIYLTFYYRFIYKDTAPLYFFGLSLNVVCMFLIYFWVPESVRWLVSVRQYHKAKQTLCKIAKINKAFDFEIKSFKCEDEFLTGHEPTITIPSSVRESEPIEVAINSDSAKHGEMEIENKVEADDKMEK